jgi:hypothetical protein
MKKIFLVLITITSLLSCSKKEGCTDSTATNFDSSAEKDNSSCIYKGNAVFWTNVNFGENIEVTVNGQTALITAYYSTAPTCGGSGCANFLFAPATYAFSAQTVSGSYTWNGNVVINSKGCSSLQLN